MWFDPQSLVSSASPPATFATFATFQGDGAAKVAESQKSQTPTSENPGPKVAESQKSQDPYGCFPETENRTEPPAVTPKDTRKVGEVIQKATRHVLRVERFARLGLPTGEAEALAERLALRDRDFDHRTACAECACLTGRPGAWRCTNYRTAGVGAPSLPGVFVAQMLQHCRGFKEGIK